MGFLDNPNKVPEFQRAYQAAYRQHTRIWKIHPRSKFLMTPYLFLLYGSIATTTYGMGRKVLGYNSFF
ncbi:hypothetical protein SPI_03237 [Niveomyces insectorum RCEF 264]|uniref:Uncharacterized protein n=1 Tax=Niveomyces insectorum RCEF 264 TaxID=1081102 RepID=A0A162MNP2_9HYPO|nr:hypothetical protein SPI_03237 [Niveomyces insectorum RCEF 264]